MVRFQPDAVAVEQDREEVLAHRAQPIDVVALGAALVRRQADSGDASPVRQDGEAAREDGRPLAPIEGVEFERLPVAQDRLDDRAEAVVLVEQVAG